MIFYFSGATRMDSSIYSVIEVKILLSTPLSEMSFKNLVIYPGMVALMFLWF